MAHGLLELLRYPMLALLWLFVLYAARTVYSEHRRYRLDRQAALLAEGGPGTGAEQLPDARPQLRLRVLEPAEARGEHIELAREVTIGRSEGCVVSLPADSYASSLHARVFPRGAEAWIEDLGSTNGTYLNERRLDGPARLKRGDRVRVGGTVLEVVK